MNSFLSKFCCYITRLLYQLIRRNNRQLVVVVVLLLLLLLLLVVVVVVVPVTEYQTTENFRSSITQILSAEEQTTKK